MADKITEEIVINPTEETKAVSEMTEEEKTEFFGITEDSVEEATEKAAALSENEAVTELEEFDGVEKEEIEEEEIEKYDDAPPEGEKLGSLTLIYTEQDIFDVIKIQERSRMSLRVMSLAVIFLPMVGVATATINLIKEPDSGISTLLLWTMVLLFVFYSYIIAPKKNAKRTFAMIEQEQNAGNVSTFTLYEGGIYAESKFGLQTFKWDEFKEVHECPAGIVIVTRSRGPVFFPKRLLKGVDRDRLSRVFEENFGRKYYVCNYGAENKKNSK